LNQIKFLAFWIILKKPVFFEHSSNIKGKKMQAEKAVILFKPHISNQQKKHALKIILENNFELVEVFAPSIVSQEFLDEFYEEHIGKPYFKRLCDYMSTGALQACVISSNGSTIENFRKLMGSAVEPAPGTLRAMFAKSTTENGFHCSDSITAFKREYTLVSKTFDRTTWEKSLSCCFCNQPAETGIIKPMCYSCCFLFTTIVNDVGVKLQKKK
jgi:nucleoside-diphosphate kinase